MLRSFRPFLRPGNCLELGSFKGDFTRRLLAHFDDITCVEASDQAIEAARKQVGGKVKFVNARFETAQLPVTYDNIVLTHVLEHLDDPVAVLGRINREWLAPSGAAFSGLSQRKCTVTADRGDDGAYLSQCCGDAGGGRPRPPLYLFAGYARA